VVGENFITYLSIAGALLFFFGFLFLMDTFFPNMGVLKRNGVFLWIIVYDKKKGLGFII